MWGFVLLLGLLVFWHAAGFRALVVFLILFGCIALLANLA